MRPGIVFSIVIHVALVIYLTIALAFHAPEKVKDDDIVVTMKAPPPPPPPPPPDVKQPVFIPRLAPAIVAVATTVAPIPIPAQPELKRQPAAPPVVTQEKQVVIQPHPISIVKPQFPDRAQDRNVSGYVDFELEIGPDGSVGEHKVIAEVPEGYGFAREAEKVFPRWKFEPKKVNGNPVPYTARYRFSFKLS